MTKNKKIRLIIILLFLLFFLVAVLFVIVKPFGGHENQNGNDEVGEGSQPSLTDTNGLSEANNHSSQSSEIFDDPSINETELSNPQQESYPGAEANGQFGENEGPDAPLE